MALRSAEIRSHIVLRRTSRFYSMCVFRLLQHTGCTKSILFTCSIQFNHAHFIWLPFCDIFFLIFSYIFGIYNILHPIYNGLYTALSARHTKVNTSQLQYRFKNLELVTQETIIISFQILHYPNYHITIAILHTFIIGNIRTSGLFPNINC